MRVLLVAAVTAIIILNTTNASSSATPVFSDNVCEGVRNDAVERQKQVERLSKKWIDTISTDVENRRKLAERQKQVRAYVAELATIYSAFCKP